MLKSKRFPEIDNPILKYRYLFFAIPHVFNLNVLYENATCMLTDLMKNANEILYNLPDNTIIISLSPNILIILTITIITFILSLIFV